MGFIAVLLKEIQTDVMIERPLSINADWRKFSYIRPFIFFNE